MSSQSTRTTSEERAPRRRWLRLGPGTILAMAIAAAILISGRLSQPPTVGPDAGKIAYESDSAGKMRRVDTPATVAEAVPPLWKPEPSLLLDRDKGLALTDSQRKELRSLSTRWLKHKESLNRQIEQASAGAGTLRRSGSSASIGALRESLAGYSELSREYDAVRSQYWQLSLSLLTASQRKRVEQFAPRAR